MLDHDESARSLRDREDDENRCTGSVRRPAFSDQATREVEALRQRISRLYTAMRHVSASLDLDTVLHGVVESARALTGARRGMITTIDGAGQPRELQFSGLTGEEQRNLAEWADGPRMFEHLRDLPGVVRVADLRDYARSLGYAAELLPRAAFQGTPIRHRGVHVGSFFLAEKECGGEFTAEDEEILALFAAQAASAIANARTHRAEQQARANFLTMVSQELRAPLTSIKGSAATVLGSAGVPDAAEVRQLFRIVDDQANHMQGLIRDLLDAGRIDSGTLAVAPEPTPVVTLVDQARNTFLSGGGRHTVLIDLPPELPPVMADRQRVVQVLNNLFANAARQSPEDSPISVSAWHDGVHVAVSVSDNGRGVPAEQLPRLFERYTGSDGRGDNGGLGDAGPGLAICKGLVEAHGGRIKAESRGLGRGTQVTFTLPVAESADADAPGVAVPDHSVPARDDHEHVPILVVDDDPQTLRYLRDVLTSAGYAPLVTGEPREVSRIIKAEQPRLVLLDLMLPGTDGIELLERLPELAEIPVIFVSGYGRDETIARALESGATDYIVKPFSPTELTARIRAALRTREQPVPFMVGELAIHYEQRLVTVAEREIPLTATEFEILRVLSLSAGRVASFDVLLRKVWGRADLVGGSERLRAFVKKLRRKLGDDAARPIYIFSERGVGYRMARPGAS